MTRLLYPRQRIGPNILLPAMAVLWGVAVTLQGSLLPFSATFVGIGRGSRPSLLPVDGCADHSRCFDPRIDV